MLRSMTGFARAAAESATHEVVVELRSVNHRYLDVKLRGTSGLAPLEKHVRDRVAESLARGKVDVSVHVKARGESTQVIEVDRPLMKEFVRIAGELGQELQVGTSLTLSDVIGFTPAFQVRERDLSEASGLRDTLDEALGRALDALDGMRGAEGAELSADFEQRLETLGDLTGRIEALSEAKRAARREDLEAKVSELLGSAVEAPAIAMEVAKLVERADIAEEITRLRSHLELWKTTVGGGGPCGKKLDFIVQEMNREVNTIGSKSQDAAIAEHVISMKAEIERVREQVQNVE